jgi:hypothetical protein
MPNHHEKDLTAVLVRSSEQAPTPLLSATVAEGYRTVKQTAYSPARPAARPTGCPLDSSDEEAPVLGTEPALSPR